MEENKAVSFCDEWLSSWTGNRPGELIQFYSPDAFYSDPAVPGGLNGHNQILPYFQKLLAANPDWKWERKEIFLTEKGFTLKWQAHIPIGASAVNECGLDIVEIDGSRITRNEVCFDRTNLLKALKNYKAK